MSKLPVTTLYHTSFTLCIHLLHLHVTTYAKMCLLFPDTRYILVLIGTFPVVGILSGFINCKGFTCEPNELTLYLMYMDSFSRNIYSTQKFTKLMYCLCQQYIFIPSCCLPYTRKALM